jgi:hypothetical protein
MKNVLRRIAGGGLSAVILVALVFAATAQGQAQTMPPNTNPAQRVIYPGEGQDEQAQMNDQLECYRWSSQQTNGWDPYVAYNQLVEQGYAAQQTAEQAQGGLIRGAAGGALVGLAIGAIAGDAGKGAAIGAVAGGVGGGRRSRRAQAQAQAQADAATEAFDKQMQVWDRNYVACMQGRKYTVN